MLPNFITHRQKLCEISAVENLSSRNSGPKIIKIPQDLACTNNPNAGSCYGATRRTLWC